jgi:hypothetical protein
MSRSPFQKYANAFLTLEIPTGGLRVDEETGNQLPIYEKLSIEAIMSAARDPTERSLPGVDANSIYLEGCLVNPKQFPVGIQPPLECEAVVDGRKGRLKLAIAIRTGIDKMVEKKTGQVVQGYFNVIG